MHNYDSSGFEVLQKLVPKCNTTSKSELETIEHDREQLPVQPVCTNRILWIHKPFHYQFQNSRSINSDSHLDWGFIRPLCNFSKPVSSWNGKMKWKLFYNYQEEIIQFPSLWQQNGEHSLRQHRKMYNTGGNSRSWTWKTCIFTNCYTFFILLIVFHQK